MPGMASEASPSIATSAPSTIIVHIAASLVSVHRKDRTATTPSTTSAQSYGRVHGRTAVSAIETTSVSVRASVLNSAPWLAGRSNFPKCLLGHSYLSSDSPLATLLLKRYWPV